MDLFTTSAGEEYLLQAGLPGSVQAVQLRAELYTNPVPLAKDTPLSSFRIAAFAGYIRQLITGSPTITPRADGTIALSWGAPTWTAFPGTKQRNRLSISQISDPGFNIYIAYYANSFGFAGLPRNFASSRPLSQSQLASALVAQLPFTPQANALVSAQSSGPDVIYTQKQPGNANASFAVDVQYTSSLRIIEDQSVFLNAGDNPLPVNEIIYGLLLTDLPATTVIGYSALATQLPVTTPGQTFSISFDLVWGC